MNMLKYFVPALAFIFTCFLVVTLLGCAPVFADTLYGPYQATVERVKDGDTVAVSIATWPNETKNYALRINGVNTPENIPRWSCGANGIAEPVCQKLKQCERVEGREATQFVKQLLAPGDTITVVDIHEGKYAGRMLGDILIGDTRLSTRLIESGHGRPYDGGGRGPWCRQ